MEKLLIRSQQRVQSVATHFVREIMGQVNWDNWLIAIRGARGVGKTTLLLQRIKLYFNKRQDVAFINFLIM